MELARVVGGSVCLCVADMEPARPACGSGHLGGDGAAVRVSEGEI